MPRKRSLAATILLRWKYSPTVLYAAVFLFAMQGLTVWVVLPLQILRLGGSKTAVGSIGGLWFATYVSACLLLGPRVDRIGVKSLVLVATATSATLVTLMAVESSVAGLLTLTLLLGAAMSMFWPPMMGWLSTGHEGARLNKRLGLFNLSWSLGSILAPWIAGGLMRISSKLAFAMAVACALSAGTLVAGTRKRRTYSLPTSAGGPALPAEDPAQKVFRWMSRIALFASWLAIGMLRFPLASRIKELSLDPEGIYAAAVGASSFVQMATFLVLGRTSRWHYKPVLPLLFQLISAGAILGVGLCSSTGPLIALVAVGTVGLSMSYSSHLYYGVSGTGRRSASMAVHEIILSAGFAIGSFFIGGLIGERFGMPNAYKITAALLAAAVTAQALIYLLGRPRRSE